MLPTVPDRALAELGRTEGDPDTLALLVRDQDTRRLLLVRAVLDAAEGADPAVISAGVRRRVREDWHLLEEADRAGTARYGAAAGGSGGDSPDSTGVRPPVVGGGTAHRSLSPARARLLHPLAGPWIRRCLSGLDTEAVSATPWKQLELRHDLAHFSAIAAVAAARARISFDVRLTAADGLLALPSLGALHAVGPGDAPVTVLHRQGRLTLRQRNAADIVVHLESGTGAWSSALAWAPAYTLPGLLPGGTPVPLDDLDPYRTAPGGPHHHGPSGPVTLDDTERKRWLQSWSGTAAALRLGGDHRVTEAVTLLRCLVPLAVPNGGAAGDGRAGGGYSAVRKEAFGAVLSSTPPTPAGFAATLVHELQHTKLTALSEMVTLHHADRHARYFAPWRPDPRPYDGLLQGAYSHVALADFFQRRALADTSPAHRESAWAQHARYREQVGAVLPVLVGSSDLTPRGRQFVDGIVAVYERMARHPAPRDQAVRAQEYVRAARALWLQRNEGQLRQSRD